MASKGHLVEYFPRNEDERQNRLTTLVSCAERQASLLERDVLTVPITYRHDHDDSRCHGRTNTRNALRRRTITIWKSSFRRRPRSSLTPTAVPCTCARTVIDAARARRSHCSISQPLAPATHPALTRPTPTTWT